MKVVSIVEQLTTKNHANGNKSMQPCKNMPLMYLAT